MVVICLFDFYHTLFDDIPFLCVAKTKLFTFLSLAKMLQ